MNRKRIIIIACTVLLTGAILTVIIMSQGTRQPTTETVESQARSGVSQNKDDNQTQTPTPTSSSEPVVIPVKRADPELLTTIVNQQPSLADASGKASFAIVSSVKTKNAWYVITILNTKDPTVGKAKIIMKDNGNQGGLVLIAGPGTRFDSDVIALPDEVRALL